MRKISKGIVLFSFILLLVFLILEGSSQVANVKFRTVAANPSSLRSQRVPIKVYLPKEVKPDDIIDLGTLEVEFDPDRSLYYLYGSVLLEPSQIRVFNVEVRDIWFIPQKDLDAVEEKVGDLVKAFENSKYLDRMKAIARRVEDLIDEILKTQKDEAISSSQHIGVYRTNTKALAHLKEEINEMEKILRKEGGPLTPDMLTKTKFDTEAPTKTATWIVIFVIIIFLAFLSLIIFFTWYRQAKATEKIIADAKKTVFRDFEGKKETG
ncbi:MAG: hypothetical protein JRI35_05115 [Deltaproteobacteria bacterium]|nr:hypothetical protein [Deltaproteobacteria bacterium]MBW2045234.1 hypothetical protein [Deltaproteobacteria bacterium]